MRAEDEQRTVSSLEWLDVHDTTPRGEKALTDWYSVVSASAAYEWPDEEPETLAQTLRELRNDEGGWQNLVVLIRDDRGRPVAALRVDLPTKENLDSAELRVTVHPDHRRLGHGTMLLRAAEEMLPSEQRTMIYVAERTSDRAESAGRGEGFTAKNGYQLQQRMIRRKLVVADSMASLDDLETACRRPRGGIRLRPLGRQVPRRSGG